MDAGSSAGDEAARRLRAAERLRQKAARLEAGAVSYAKGRQGEMAVAQALEELREDGYLRIDDCRWPGRAQANIDHVLIGPAGLFVIDAKNWSGRVEVRDGVLRQNGYRRSREVDGVSEATRVVGGLVAGGVPRTTGVLCLCGQAQVLATAVGSNCAVVSLPHIVDWIRRQPLVLSSTAVNALHDELQGQLEPASRTAPDAAHSPVPDFVPSQWPAGPVRRESPAPMATRPWAASSTRQFRPHRFSRRSAVVGRILLLLLALDGIGTAAATATNRGGDVVVSLLCLAWLVRLERRRPIMIKLRR